MNTFDVYDALTVVLIIALLIAAYVYSPYHSADDSEIKPFLIEDLSSK